VVLKASFIRFIPKKQKFLAIKPIKNVQDIPSTPDLGILIVPTKLVCELLESFGQKGIQHALIITAGFKETGMDGKKLETHILSIARQYGMRFLGPNCLGVINMHLPFNATVAPAPVNKGCLSLASIPWNGKVKII
jgi:Acyl-CoA synthetase (NDP forming)